METVLKNHRTLITLLGLWATPFFISHFKNVDKRRVVKPKKNTVFFTKGKKKKKEKEKTFTPRSAKSDSTLTKGPVSTHALKVRLEEPILVLEKGPRQIRKNSLLNEGPSKKESGLSPPIRTKLFK